MTDAPPELMELATPRRLVTRELSPFNAFYGYAELLRTYAGIGGTEPLKAAVEHGGPTLFPFDGDPDLSTRLPRYFCAAPGQARYFAEHASSAALPVAIGPAILYAQALAPVVSPPRGRLLVFPAHSSDYLTARYDIHAAVERLRTLRHEFDEVVVCLYWRDIVLGRAAPFLDAGFDCVTAGHMFDRRFLFRLLELISSASVVLTHELGSHVLYALVLERPVWLEPLPTEYELASDAPHGPIHRDTETLSARAEELLAQRVDEVHPEQRAFAAELAGTGSFRSPAELAALIGDAEAAYRAETPLPMRLRLETEASARRLWNSRPW